LSVAYNFLKNKYEHLYSKNLDSVEVYNLKKVMEIIEELREESKK
jgi:hypothetical protein